MKLPSLLLAAATGLVIGIVVGLCMRREPAQPIALGPDARAMTQQQACETLKRAALELCLSRTNLEGHYYCDPLPEQRSYYVLGLRYNVRPDELVGSNLLGWFAVRKSDGIIFEWDINEDQILSVVTSECPFEPN